MHPPANSSHKGLLVRYVAPTRADAQVREVRECARIGFAFFKPIIYQSRPPPDSTPNPILRLAAASQRRNSYGREEKPTVEPTGIFLPFLAEK